MLQPTVRVFALVLSVIIVAPARAQRSEVLSRAPALHWTFAQPEPAARNERSKPQSPAAVDLLPVCAMPTAGAASVESAPMPIARSDSARMDRMPIVPSHCRIARTESFAPLVWTASAVDPRPACTMPVAQAGDADNMPMPISRTDTTRLVPMPVAPSQCRNVP